MACCDIGACWLRGDGPEIADGKPDSEIVEWMNLWMGWLVLIGVGLTTVDMETGCNEGCCSIWTVLLDICFLIFEAAAITLCELFLILEVTCIGGVCSKNCIRT